jgi:hypothetical protein
VLLKTSSCFSASISFHFLLQAIAGDIGLGHRLPSLHTLFAPVVSPSCGGGSFCVCCIRNAEHPRVRGEPEQICLEALQRKASIMREKCDCVHSRIVSGMLSTKTSWRLRPKSN